MQATHKTSSSTCNVLLSSFLLCSNRIILQTPVHRVFDHAIWLMKTWHSHSLYSNTVLFLSVGSPLSTSLSSVQDISPPSTPSNNSITVVSPYTNSSTPRNITTSPHLFNHSPGLSLSNPNTPLVSGAYSSSSANNRSQYLQSQYRNYSSSSGTQVYQNADQNNGATTEPVSPAPVLHPLQQATLLQQQQLVGVSCVRFNRIRLGLAK